MALQQESGLTPGVVAMLPGSALRTILDNHAEAELAAANTKIAVVALFPQLEREGDGVFVADLSGACRTRINKLPSTQQEMRRPRRVRLIDPSVAHLDGAGLASMPYAQMAALTAAIGTAGPLIDRLSK